MVILYDYHNVKESSTILIISLTLVYGFIIPEELSQSDMYIECGGVPNREQKKQNAFCLIMSLLLVT